MTITPTDAIAGVILGFTALAYWVFRPRRESDQPGPHNNWRRPQRGVQSGFHEGISDASGGDGGHF